MPALDLSYTPSIEAALIGLDNRPRFDLVESEPLEQNSPAFAESSVRSIEESGGVAYFEDEDTSSSKDRYEDVKALVEHNSKIEAQEIAGQPAAPTTENHIKKGLAHVASAAETVGTKDALARLDQNGDGRIDQVEVQKGIRADEETSTFAALTQYQKTLEVYQKLSESGDFEQSNLFGGDDVQVEKLFDDENLEKDLYEDGTDQAQQPEPELLTEVVA
jgi:hypothetical protein